MTSLCNAYRFASYIRDESTGVCLLTSQNTRSVPVTPRQREEERRPGSSPSWGARGPLLGEAQSELAERNRCLRNTLIKSDILVSSLAAPTDPEDPKREFPEPSRVPRAPGGACPREADGRTASGRPKFPSATKICCSCPVYTNNLLSGAWTCPSATFYHLTEGGLHGVKRSPRALASTKQPRSVGT